MCAVHCLNFPTELQSCFMISSFTEEYFFASLLVASFGIPLFTSSFSKAFLAFLTFQPKVNQIRNMSKTSFDRYSPPLTMVEIFIFSPKWEERSYSSSSVRPFSASFSLIFLSISFSASDLDFPPLPKSNFFMMSPKLVNTLM